MFGVFKTDQPPVGLTKSSTATLKLSTEQHIHAAWPVKIYFCTRAKFNQQWRSNKIRGSKQVKDNKKRKNAYRLSPKQENKIEQVSTSSSIFKTLSKLKYSKEAESSSVLTLKPNSIGGTTMFPVGRPLPIVMVAAWNSASFSTLKKKLREQKVKILH